MNFARHLTLLLLASASLPALAQENVPVQPPAPVVRSTPKPAQTDGAPPPQQQQHLMVSHPVAKPDAQPKPTPKSPAAAVPGATPKPLVSKPTETGGAAVAQLSSGPFNRTLVVLDPSHGGGDTGSRINDQLTEKDVTLALGFRLRSLLAARGFTVVMTRDSDSGPGPGTAVSLDDRAGVANHARPVACLLLHATASGSGVHLYTSELDPTPGEAVPAPWLSAQAAWVGQSQKLAGQMGAAIGRAKIPLVVSRASIRPVDSLTCPALVVELAPNGSDDATLNDAGYQQRVAEAIAGALVFWQNQAQPPVRLAPPAATPASAVTSGVQP